MKGITREDILSIREHAEAILNPINFDFVKTEMRSNGADIEYEVLKNLSERFLVAADELSVSADEKSIGAMLYLYRHSVELSIKSVVFAIKEFDCFPLPGGGLNHDIMKYVDHVSIWESGKNISSSWDQVRKLGIQFEGIDEKGTFIRYLSDPDKRLEVNLLDMIMGAHRVFYVSNFFVSFHVKSRFRNVRRGEKWG
jgi:hypothetical protein